MIKKELIKSYAKINLSLDVLGRYKNNLHKIQSIISYINLHDRIYIKSINKPKHIIKFNGSFSKNLKNNTISKLLNILDKKNLIKKKFDIDRGINTLNNLISYIVTNIVNEKYSSKKEKDDIIIYCWPMCFIVCIHILHLYKSTKKFTDYFNSYESV